MTTILNHPRPIQRAVIKMMDDPELAFHLYFFFQMELKPTDSITDTIATNAIDTIVYNPLWVEQRTSDEMIFIICHEVEHTIHLHPIRCKQLNYDSRRFNIAADLHLNNRLLQWEPTKDLCPSDALTTHPRVPPNFDYANNTTEDVYLLLSEDDEDNEDNEDNTDGNGQPRPLNGNDIINIDEDNNSASGTNSSPELSQSDINAIENEIRSKITAAAQQAEKNAGTVPSHLQAEIEQIQKPKVNWRAKLRQYATTPTRSRYTYRRLDRRYQHQDPMIVFPTPYSREPSGVFIAVDVSASVLYDQAFPDAMAEVQDISKNSRKSLLLPFDTHVARTIKLSHDTDIEQLCNTTAETMYGGGGTDIASPFKYIDDNKLKPKVLIVITDGYGPCNVEVKPSYPVVFVLVGYPSTTSYLPKWSTKCLQL